jgi:hypothetical protein
LAPSAHYHRHPIIQHQPDDQCKDSMFTRNTDVSVIDQMKNEEGNGSRPWSEKREQCSKQRKVGSQKNGKRWD